MENANIFFKHEFCTHAFATHANHFGHSFAIILMRINQVSENATLSTNCYQIHNFQSENSLKTEEVEKSKPFVSAESINKFLQY